MDDIPIPRKPLPVRYTPDITLPLTSVRVHEVAFQRFLNRAFFVADGFPTPVVFATPTDAFSTFRNLFGTSNGPFAYLLDLKDENGEAFYRTMPENIVYPLISVERKGWTLRKEQSYGTKAWRGAYYLSAGTNIHLNDLANPVRIEMPTAWNYSFNVEHYCRRPDTHASFVKKLMRQFRWTGGSAQTWIPVMYPDFFGLKQVRMYLEGDRIDDASGLINGDMGISEFRASFTVVIEGYDTDLDVAVYPALWILNNSYLEAIAPGDVEKVFTISTDLRETGTNAVFSGREGLPPR